MEPVVGEGDGEVVFQVKRRGKRKHMKYRFLMKGMIYYLGMMSTLVLLLTGIGKLASVMVRLLLMRVVPMSGMKTPN